MTLVLAVYNSKTNATLFSTVFTFAKPKLGTNPKSFVVGNVVSSLVANPSKSYNPKTCGGANYLGLGDDWQVQLPYSSNNNPGITTISSPSFESFASPYFYVNTTRKAIQFYTANTGVTTPGSNSPRTELRQMNSTANGIVPAVWSSSGTNKMTVKIQVDFVPATKFVIFAQIVSISGGAYFTYRVANNIKSNRLSISISVSNNVVKSSYTNIASGTKSGTFSFKLPAYSDLAFKLGSYCGITISDKASYYCQVSVFSVSV
ncbi:UNVERIFIED_CONTAM: hypothetical protein HDU68_011973 [Siphonaria sp. JEL0065]|nr:hypothetical protein HDU68_011973 [Siphonaria sp. JEL0065]